MTSNQFWVNEPTILFHKDLIFEIWPSNNMHYEQKLNAMTRLIILMTILGYILTASLKLLIVGILTLVAIYVIFKMRKQKITNKMLNEGFQVQGKQVSGLKNEENPEDKVIINPVTLESVLSKEFQEGNKKNPFSNVLLTEIMDKPERYSAPPSFNPKVDEDITKNVKKSVQFMNPNIGNTNKQLYSSLWDNFQLDQSNRIFYSTANTRIQPGDQSAFGEYLYGNMPSSKESNLEGALARVQDSYRYTLY
jgi:hypothetical protein